MNRIFQSSLAFSLVEVTLALGVAAVALLAIFGLLVTGAQTHHTAVEQSSSSDILTAVAADLRATPKTSPPGQATTSPQFKINIPANPVPSPGPTPTTLFFTSEGECSTSLSSFIPCDSSAPTPSPAPPLQTRYRLTVTFLPNGNGTKTATFANLKMTWPAAAADPAKASAAETFLGLDRN